MYSINKTLSYYVNDKFQGIAFSDIDFNDKKYNMAVYVCSMEDEPECVINLLDFKISDV